MMELRWAAGLSGVVLASALGLGCAGSTSTSEAPLSVSPTRFAQGELRDVENLLIVTDASGSMYTSGYFPHAKSLATSFIEALPDSRAPARTGEYNVGYLAFGGRELVQVDLAPFDRGALLAASEQTQVMGQSDGTGGTTPMHSVLEVVGAQLEGTRGNTAILVFSDGIADDPDRALAVAAALVEERRDPLCFHTIQVGSSAKGRGFLRGLSGVSACGSSRDAQSISDPASFSRYAHSLLVGDAPLGLRGSLLGDDAANRQHSDRSEEQHGYRRDNDHCAVAAHPAPEQRGQ